MVNWKECKLDDLVSKLGDGLHGTPKYNPHGEYFFINGSNLIDGKISVNENTKRVTVEEYNKYKKDLNDRTIFISINGTLGNIATYANEKVILGKSACYFNVKENVSKTFIKYVVTDQKFQNYIAEYATGTTIKNVPLKAIRDYSFKLPDLPTQVAIAEILSSIDDKIELNNEINKNLEELSQALFKQWFIDFEFPNEYGQPYKSSGGEMVESELGEIPKGWDVKKLSEVIEIKHGYAFKGEFFSDFETSDILVTPGNFKIGGGFNYNKFKYYSGESPEEYILQLGDLIVTMTDLSKEGDTLGYSALIPMINEKRLLHNQRIGRIRYKSSSVIKFYLYWLMRTDEYRSFILSGASGTTVKHTSPSRIGEFKTSIPDERLLKLFDQTLSSFYESEINNNLELQNLSSLRDSLLPKLISGELEVSQLLIETAM